MKAIVNCSIDITYEKEFQNKGVSTVGWMTNTLATKCGLTYLYSGSAYNKF